MVPLDCSKYIDVTEEDILAPFDGSNKYKNPTGSNHSQKAKTIHLQVRYTAIHDSFATLYQSSITT